MPIEIDPKTGKKRMPIMGRGSRVRWVLSKDWNITYDDDWRSIMREVAVESGIPYEDVERMNTAWWKYFGEMLRRVELPIIKLPFLCCVYPSQAKLFRYCEYMTYAIDRISRGFKVSRRVVNDVKAMVKHLEKLHDSYFRMVGEKKEMRRLALARKMTAIANGTYAPFERKKQWGKKDSSGNSINQ